MPVNLKTLTTDPVARADYTASADDNVIVEGIGGSETSLGWVGFAFYEANTDAVRALEVDGGDGCVAPTAETIAANSPSRFSMNSRIGSP